MPSSRSRRTHRGYSLVVLIAVIFVWQQSVPPSFSQVTNTQPNDVPELKITILEGEDGANIIKKNTTVKPVVEVRDRNKMPVAGLYITFVGPASGPHVMFEHGSSMYSTVTDSSGRATVHIMKPVGQGAFKINVNASYQGHIISTTISQTNFLTVADATAAGAGAGAGAGTPGGGGGISGLTIGLIVGAVAVGVGVAVAVIETRGGKPTGTIGPPGTPTIGAP